MDSQSARQSLLLPFDSIEMSSRPTGFKTQKISKVMLTPQMLKIGDNCAIPQRPLRNRWENLMDVLDKKYKTIEPEDMRLLAWNFLTMLVIRYNLLQIPIIIFMTEAPFIYQFNSQVGRGINYLCLAVLIIDMVLVRPNVAFYEAGKLVRCRSQITERYFKMGIWVDLVAVLVLGAYTIANTYQIIYLKILFYVKVYSLRQLDFQIQSKLQFHRVRFAIYRFFQITYFILFIVNFIGTVFFAIDYYFYYQGGYYFQTQQLWLIKSTNLGSFNIYQSFDWPVWYIYSVYWALQTSSTVGYGDFTPRNPIQVFYCDLVIMLMPVMFAYFINSIWQVINTLQEPQNQLESNWKNLKAFTKDKNIDQNMTTKISRYLEDLWKKKESPQVDRSINEILPIGIRQELELLSKGDFLQAVPMFAALVAQPQWPPILFDLVQTLKTELYTRSEWVYKLGDLVQRMYFISRGSVKLSTREGKFHYLIAPSHFGEEEFFTLKYRLQSAQTVMFTKLHYLEWNAFKSMICKDPRLYVSLAILRSITVKLLKTQ